jgi:hypothetical protein
LISDRPGDAARHRLDFVVCVAAVGLLALGFLVTGPCGGGFTFLSFAAAVGLLGWVVARTGGLVMIPLSGVLVVTLVWAGLLFASQAGCTL